MAAAGFSAESQTPPRGSTGMAGRPAPPGPVEVGDERPTRAWGEAQEIIELAEETGYVTRLIIESPPGTRRGSRQVSTFRLPTVETTPPAGGAAPAADIPAHAPTLVASGGRVSWHHTALSRQSDDDNGSVAGGGGACELAEQPPILRRLSRAAAAATAPMIAEMAEWHPGRVLNAILILIQLSVVIFYASELHDVYLVAQANPAISQDTRTESILLYPNVRAAVAGRPAAPPAFFRAKPAGLASARVRLAWMKGLSNEWPECSIVPTRHEHTCARPV